MTYQRRNSQPWNRIVVLMGALTVLGIVGCSGDSGDALPTPTDAGKRDAAKRDSALGAGGSPGATGGSGSSGDASGPSGTGGAVLVGGSGGTSVGPIDASPTRDVGPDVSDGPRLVDVGFGPEVPSGLDVSGPEAPRETGLPAVDLANAPLDAPAQPDAPVLVDTRDALPDTTDGPLHDTADRPEIAPDLPSDLPTDLATDLPVDFPADLPADLPPDAVVSPPGTCSNPGWAKSYGLLAAGSTAADKDGNIFIANTMQGPVDFGGTVGTLTSAGYSQGNGDSDPVIARFNPTTGAIVWAKNFGDPAAQTATGLAVDKSGRIGFVGDYLGSITLGSSAISNLGTFPSAYVGGLQSSDGTGLWALSANVNADIGSSAALVAIAANPGFDDFVVCGKANVAATDLNVNGQSPLAAGGGYDIVVAKIRGSNGTVIWSRQIGGAGDQSCSAAAIDDSGNVVIAGNYNGQLDFGTGAFSPASGAGNFIPWIAKLDGGSGATIAALNATPAATGRTMGYVLGIDTDPAGNVAIAGYFTNGLTFGSASLASAGGQDAYVAKVSAALSPSWAKRWGDTSNQRASSVAFDSAGDLVVVGLFTGTINIGASGPGLTAASDSTGSNDDIFVARLNGTSGDSTCALRYGDPASQAGYSVVVPRATTGASKDVPFVSGSLLRGSVLDFSSVSLTSTAGGTGSTDFWLGKF